MNRTNNEEFIIGSIFLLANKLNQIGDKILFDITFKQFILLITISKLGGGEKNINTIADFVGTTRQNVKKMLIPLEEKGYVSICKSKHDTRALNVGLTKKTYQYFTDNANATAQETGQLFNMFTENEIDIFVSNLQKLMDSYEKYIEKGERKHF